MKIFRIILITIACAWLHTSSSNAQDYYSAGKEIAGNGFAYKCEEWFCRLRVYNANNRWTRVQMTRLNGAPLPDNPNLHVEYMTGSSIVQAANTIHEIVYSVLSEPEKAMLRKTEGIMEILVYIDIKTGKAMEVEYAFFPGEGYLKIPPEKYFAMEQLIMQKVCVEITEHGKDRNYLIISSERIMSRNIK